MATVEVTSSEALASIISNIRGIPREEVTDQDVRDLRQQLEKPPCLETAQKKADSSVKKVIDLLQSMRSK